MIRKKYQEPIRSLREKVAVAVIPAKETQVAVISAAETPVAAITAEEIPVKVIPAEKLSVVTIPAVSVPVTRTVRLLNISQTAPIMQRLEQP